MNLQVQPLKILATRQVVMNKLDYSTYLTGTTKEELDKLDKLEGKFRIQASKLKIEAVYKGKQLPSDDWEFFKECFENQLSRKMVKLMEGVEEFSIVESKNGPRTWIMSEENTSLRRELLSKKGDLSEMSHHNCKYCHPLNPSVRRWRHGDAFIEDGGLVSVKKWYHMYDGKIEFSVNFRDSITADKQGNVVWNFMWSLPARDIKFTKVMWALRVLEGST